MNDSQIKTFVLDTNVVLHNPHSIFNFDDNHIVIPMTVLEELDKFKSKNNELGRNSREVARILDRLRGEGSLRQGVSTERGGQIQVLLRYDEVEGMLPGLNDNRIIGCAHMLHREGKHVVFISKDINARIKADALGIESADYSTEKVNYDELHSGYVFFKDKNEIWDELLQNNSCVVTDEEILEKNLTTNEFVVLEREGHDTILVRVFIEEDEHDGPSKTIFRRIEPHNGHIFGIYSRNIEQQLAINLLLDDDVRLVTLVGSAGTGKTLIALAAGLHKVLREEVYTKMLVSRPIMPLGQDIGYLPGSKDEKLTHWMGPVFDNLHFIFGQQERDPDEIVNRLMENETVTLEALTYIRGRSISKQYMIVDEAQNLTPHELKTIISRAGENTKIILTGDPYQIDNPYLDVNANGLTYVAEHMRGHALAGHVTLTRSERSELAGLAAEIL